jgi:hypothetical protein
VGAGALALVEVAVVVAATIDGVRRPKWAWERAGQNKVLWVVLQPLGLLFLIGLLVPLTYVIFVRPSLRRVERAGRPEGRHN